MCLVQTPGYPGSQQPEPLGLDTHIGPLAPAWCPRMAEASLRPKNTQLSKLDDLQPSAFCTYELKYLKPNNVEKIKMILQGGK